MADGSTTSYSFTLPEVGASEDTWGTKLNANWSLCDDLLDGTTAIAPDINSGTFNGTIDGATSVTADISFGDNNKAIFGTGSDLQIYHDGTASYIRDTGTGSLQIEGESSIYLANNGGTELYAAFNVNGASSLYYDNATKLATTSGGVAVTGAMYASGNIGLDTTDFISFTGNTRMDVTINGSNEFRFESDGDFHADGDVIAFSTTTASDERLKENIEVVGDAVAKCEALRGVTFDWIRDGSSSAGVIAQEVQQVLPEAVKQVTGMNGEDHLTVNYGALTSILIEAVKELSARIEELEAK